MLPFTKRPARDEGEFLNSGDVEVVRPHAAAPPSRRQSAFPSPPSDRPRVFERSASDDDEMTSVMMAKAKSSFPPASPTRGASRRPPAFEKTNTGVTGADEPRTAPRSDPPRNLSMSRSSSLRPPPPRSAPPAPFSNRPPANQFGLDTPPTMMPAPIPTELRQHAAAQMAHQNMPIAHPISVAPGPDSTSAFVASHDPPATVITTRTRVLARPTVSWAAALVAMGIFVGLVTAVVARGDADSLIDATASFVDPSHARASAAAQTPANVVANVAALAPPAPVLPPVLPPTVNTPAPLPPITSGVPVTPAAVATQDLPVANPTPERRAPVAYSAPVSRPVSELPVAKAEPKPVYHRAAPAPHRAAPVAAPAADDAVAAAPKPAAAPKGHGKKSGSSDDDGAAKAAELADEQLKAALR